MGTRTSREADPVEPVKYVSTTDNPQVQVFLLHDGSVMVCRNGNQIVHYSSKHATAQRLKKRYTR